ESYRQMICVETANALADRPLLQPGEEHTLEVEYAINTTRQR
ncbi:MAG: D-hexose-6-phosphate mutarotase, partial [Gammaproteobacteria bacterium]|nr:D-hexose-6-phosphate mutarotase [Gammaproteobacteria bacterium]